MSSKPKQTSDKSITVKIESVLADRVQKLCDTVDEKLSSFKLDEEIKKTLDHKLDAIIERSNETINAAQEIQKMLGLGFYA